MNDFLLQIESGSVDWDKEADHAHAVFKRILNRRPELAEDLLEEPEGGNEVADLLRRGFEKRLGRDSR